MKAVIPAAGLGTRFLPATKSQPKEMLPLVDKPSIQFVVEECVDSGIDDIIIITGRGKRVIEDHFDHSVELEAVLDKKGKEDLKEMVADIASMVDIHFIRQKEALGLGHAILRAEKHVGDEPFAVLLGDDIVFSKKPCTKQLFELYYKHKASIIAVEKVPEHMISSYGIIDGTEVGPGLHRITHLVEKPKPEDSPSNLGIIGRYLLTPGIFEELKKTKKGRGGEIQLTDGLMRLSKKEEMYGWEFEGVRHDLGNKFEYLKASLEYGLLHEEVGPRLREYFSNFNADEVEAKYR
ncbi:MAG: UTP--glucose-1-phosphate uridylyltransferase GalU [Candidatus Altiarchaeales archaeon]|nr:UTP--glucose-1-phosphate uridylyltransferase GalU [Candidatus Altiarchaeales archaeon]MBD3416620.1 UTP--glucose-1-phosphate uridylyltransferase GalU [Candidatus Altiarchaeales archaeon]